MVTSSRSTSSSSTKNYKEHVLSHSPAPGEPESIQHTLELRARPDRPPEPNWSVGLDSTSMPDLNIPMWV